MVECGMSISSSARSGHYIHTCTGMYVPLLQPACISRFFGLLNAMNKSKPGVDEGFSRVGKPGWKGCERVRFRRSKDRWASIG